MPSNVTSDNRCFVLLWGWRHKDLCPSAAQAALFPLLACVLQVAVLLSTKGLDAQTTAPGYLPIAAFGSSNRAINPVELLVTEGDEALISENIKTMPKFPRYLYSGCQDRAHAAYLRMDIKIRPKIMKIWVVSPSMYTAAIHGYIHSTKSDPAYKAVDWGYHVALAYRTKHGLMIIDPALNPDEVVSEESWFHEMDTSQLTFWTLTEGAVYQFYLSPSDPNAKNQQIWDGNTFGYTDSSLAENWIPKALARDAIGVDAMQNRTCQELSRIATKPQDLLNELSGTSPSETTDPCAVSRKKFSEQVEYWEKVLSPNL